MQRIPRVDSTDSVGIEYGKLVQQLLANNRFRRRPASWTAAAHGLFFKIPRISDDPASDATDPRVVGFAEEEARFVNLLASVSDDVLPVIDIFGGVLIKREVAAIDLRAEVLDAASREVRQHALNDAVAVCARIHTRASLLLPDLELYDYRCDRYFPMSSALYAEAAARPATVLIQGLELRNFHRETTSGRLIFFDPHGVKVGIPEDDFARLLLSFVMLKWERGALAQPWLGFSLTDLLQEYRRIAGTLDARLLRYAFEMNVRMRRHYALAAASQAVGPIRWAMRLYAKVFFHKVKRWWEKQDV